MSDNIIKNSILILLLAALMIFTFVCCGKSDRTEGIETDESAEIETGELNLETAEEAQTDTDTETEKEPEIVIETEASIETIKADITKNSLNCFTLNNKYEILNIDTIEVVKRDTVDTYDTVYLNVAYKNEFYTVCTEMTMYYHNYTTGGWIMESYDVTSRYSYANKPCYTDAEISSMFAKQFDSFKVESRNTYTSPNGSLFDDVEFTATKDYNYLTVTFKGNCSMFYEYDVWNSNVFFTGVNYDWSRMQGTWQYTHENGDTITFNISDIAVENDRIKFTYSYNTSPWGWLDFTYGHNFVNYSKSGSADHLITSTNLEEICILDAPTDVMTHFNFSISLGGEDWGNGKAGPTNVGGGANYVKFDRDEGAILHYYVETNKGGDGYNVKMTKIG